MKMRIYPQIKVLFSNVILISISFSQSIWSEPVMLNFDGLSAISPSINRTNDTLFFSRDAKIYYTVWQDTGWRSRTEVTVRQRVTAW